MSDTYVAGRTLGEAPAFPMATIDGFSQYGMTLRQWYAGMALQGLLANPDVSFKDPDTVTAAVAAQKFADALLAELDKPVQP